MTKLIITTVCCLLAQLFMPVNAQTITKTPYTIWSKTYGGSGRDDIAQSVCETYDSGYVIAGYTNSNDGDVHNNHGGYDFWILKLNAEGDTIWTRCFGGSDDDEAFDVTQTKDSAYIIIGQTSSNDGDVHNNHGGSDYWIIKLNNVGDTIWSKTYGGSKFDVARSVCETYDSGYVIAGYTNSNDGDVHNNHGGYDFWILKLNAEGDTIWTRCFGGSGNDKAYSIDQTLDSGYVVAGFSSSNNGDVHGNHGESDYWIVKLNKVGDTLWTRCFGGSYDDKATSIQQTMDTGYIIAGYSSSSDGDINDDCGSDGFYFYFIIKLNSSGQIIWEKCFRSGPGYFKAHSIQQTNDKGFIVTGIGEIAMADYITYILKIDSTGNIIWNNTYDNSFYLAMENFSNDIIKSNLGGFIITESENLAANISKICEGYQTHYTDTINGKDSVCFEGECYHEAGEYYDTLIAQNGCDSVLKLTLVDTNISTSSKNEIYRNIDEITIQPNPSENYIHITNLKNQYVVKIFDMNGRQLITTDKQSVNISRLSDGIYFIKIFDNNGKLRYTEKLIKQ
jgi:hypothetical protein